MTKSTPIHNRHTNKLKRTIPGMVVTLFLISSCLNAQSIIKNLPTPQGYKRVSYSDTTFSGWIQSLELKSDKTIKMYEGSSIPDGYFNQSAVVKMPLLFKSDLEQCADYCMRFWAEFHKIRGTLDSLYLYNYGGQKKYFSKSGQTYLSFLKTAFMNTNSFSLKKGCATVEKENLRPGDMFVQNGNGGIGHVSMIVDECVSTNGPDRLYLIGFSFMPAQEFHIESAQADYGTAGWFTYDGAMRYLEQVFTLTPVLRRF
jgi:hypothetical protein